MKKTKLVRMLAEQSVDFLSGRFLQVANNIDDLTQRADQIVKDDLYTMRLRA